MPRRRPNELRDPRSRRGRSTPVHSCAPVRRSTAHREPDVLRILVTATATAAQTLFLVNGEPLFGAGDREESGLHPDTVLAPGGDLYPTGSPHRAYVACRGDCVPKCCGTSVEIRLDGRDTVVWRIRPRSGGGGLPPRQPEPHEARFEREQYLFALEWAHSDRRWEWPGYQVARRLRARLRDERPLARLGCRECSVSCARDREDVVVLLHFDRPGGWHWPYGHAYRLVFPVAADEDPAARADAVFDEITVSDPRGRLLHEGVADQTAYLRTWECGPGRSPV